MTPDRDQDQAPDLLALARARFGDHLTAAEIKLLNAAPKGEVAVCGSNSNPNDPANDPANAASWGPDRQILPDLIRWLCVDRQAKELVDPKGIRVYGAKITEPLDLDFLAVPFPLALWHCRLMHDLKLLHAEIPVLSLQGTWLHSLRADGCRVKGDVFLRNRFRGDGEVQLVGAEIGGDLDCNDATFSNPFRPDMAGSGSALNAGRAVVEGSVFLNGGFSAEGEVRFLGAQIQGNLSCSGGTFKNPPQSGEEAAGRALTADRVVVNGGVFLREDFHAEGEVRLLGAQVRGSLDCSGGTFKNPRQSGEEATGDALSADRAVVNGDVFLGNGFSAEGSVRLLGAQIQGNLDCSGGTFKNPPQPGEEARRGALVADGVDVNGAVFLRSGFRAEGAVRFPGAQIAGILDCSHAMFVGELIARGASIKGTLFWRDLPDPARARLNLMNASAGALSDEAPSWPAHGNLWLDGFVYGRISSRLRDAKTRLDWLARQDPFTPQPYRQLSKVLKEEGDDRAALDVLFEMEHRRRREKDRSLILKTWSWILRSAIGYGYHPGKALKWLGRLALVGFLLFWIGYSAGSMVPADKDAYACFRKDRQLPPTTRGFMHPCTRWKIPFPSSNSVRKIVGSPTQSTKANELCWRMDGSPRSLHHFLRLSALVPLAPNHCRVGSRHARYRGCHRPRPQRLTLAPARIAV